MPIKFLSTDSHTGQGQKNLQTTHYLALRASRQYKNLKRVKKFKKKKCLVISMLTNESRVIKKVQSYK